MTEQSNNNPKFTGNMKEGWEYKKVKDVALVVGGSTPKTNVEEYWGGDHFWVTPAELNGSKYISRTVRTITDKAIKKTNLTLLPIGTVLLSSRAPIGKVCITKEVMYCNQGFKNFVCGETLYNEYAYYFLKHNVSFLQSLGSGATFKEISKKVVEEIEIPVPPLSEQQRIVEELDLLSSIIEKKKAQLKELDSLAQSIFYDMFGDKYYENVSLGEVVEIKSTLVSPKELPYSDMLHVSPSNIISNVGNIIDCVKAKEESLISGKYTFSKGMILYSKIRPNLNKVAIPSFDGICSADMYPLSIKGKVNNIFIWRLLLSKDFLEYAIKHSGRARMPKLNRESLFAYTFPLPPLPLQQQFAEKVEAIERQKELIKQSIKEVETLFNSRMDYYFN